MKRLWLIMVIGVLMGFNVDAQQKRMSESQDASIGVRISSLRDSYLGITFQQNLQKGRLEALLERLDNSLLVTALWEYQQQINGSDFYWYPGAGLHLGGYREGISFGIDLIAGLEYQFPKAPFVLSFDIKPHFPLTSERKEGISTGLSFRYRF